MRADLPSFSLKDVVEGRYYVYGVGVYDLNDYARNEHPGGEQGITDMVGKSIEEIWATDGMKFHKKKEILELLEGMRIGNFEGTVDKPKRCTTPKVVPQVNGQEYRLELTTYGGNNLKALSLEELRRYPKHSIVSSIPCKNDSTKPETGSIWTGVQLRDILRESKINIADYDEIRFECLDVSSTTEKPYGSTVSVDRVFNEPDFDVLLAYEKDGSEIPPKHGYPVRVVMPQVTGGKNVKWLQRVVLVRKTDKVVR
ncbi:sulfite oxidase, mitochondrial-like isoform X2 [Phymastichus coffea]|nr:sulfite oxidase, mitochondrial-like isoform X2 [Phymastichus coffea]